MKTESESETLCCLLKVNIYFYFFLGIDSVNQKVLEVKNGHFMTDMENGITEYNIDSQFLRIIGYGARIWWTLSFKWSQRHFIWA